MQVPVYRQAFGFFPANDGSHIALQISRDFLPGLKLLFFGTFDFL